MSLGWWRSGLALPPGSLGSNPGSAGKNFKSKLFQSVWISSRAKG